MRGVVRDAGGGVLPEALNIAGHFQRLLPLSTRRDLTDALEVTPGVTARNLIANNGTQTYMLRGTDVEQHVVQIDCPTW